MSDSEIILELKSELEIIKVEKAKILIEAEESLHELNNKLLNLEDQLETSKTLIKSSKEKEEIEINKNLELTLLLQQEKSNKEKEVSNEIDLKRSLEELEREKRSLLINCVKVEEEKVTLEESLTSLRALHTSLQSSHSHLESALQESTTTSRTSLLRLQTLTSTVTSLEADKLFLTTELERGRNEWAEYRREKHSELIKVQTQLENHQIEEKNAKSSLETLRISHEALTNRHLDTVQTLSKIREELAVSENNFANEMGSMKRLVDMMENRESERVARVDEVERGLEDERSGRIEREAELLEDLRLERERTDLLEVKCGELREAIERGAASFSGLYPQEDDMSSPSNRGSFALSPSAQMAVRSQKSGRSYAEVYGEYIRMQEELLKERAESARLGDCLSQIMGDIEERAPLLKEQRIEYERLSTEYAQLAAQLSDTVADRDESDRRAEAHRLDIDRLERDNAILGNQLRDLGRQVRALMRSVAVNEISGIVERSIEGDNDEEEEEIRRRATESTDTDAIVSAHLVTFQTINELQIQNQKLLRITREMGAQMEVAEEEALGRRRNLENHAVEEAHELIIKLKEEVEKQRSKTEAFLRERDMLRRMLSQRGEGSGGEMVGMDENSVDAARLLADVQTNFDAYKVESGIHTDRLRDDLAQAQRDANNARTELAKLKAHAEFTTERFQLLNDSYSQQAVELAQASKRNLQLQQAMAKQDSLTYKSSEELLALRSSVDQLRHENTNFRTEQQVWKSVENRLIDENAALNRERSHLADLMGNLQTMQNELERSGSESRKRLEDQVSRLDNQTAELREKLSQETESNRQMTLRREIEVKSNQDRLDNLTLEHQTTRENLLVAKTSQEHLEQRVSDLLLQITSKEEKLAIYEGRSASNGVDITQTREQQLEVIVADLRAELRSAKSDLERATAHVEQYQAIAESEGESLRQLTITYDEYKLSTDASLAEKDNETSGIRERLHSLTSEITAGQNLNSELHRQIEEERRTIEKERKSYEDGLANLRAADVAAREAQLAAQVDSRRQAQLAKEANEKYQRELLDHAEDVKRFNVVSQELESIRATIREYQSASEISTANLIASEASWARQKVALEQEIVDFKKRCVDLTSQNGVLHDHLENFGNIQTARLQNTQSSEENSKDQDSVETSDDQLKEVIRYLRREKDIGDLQLEFTKQELTRVRQQYEFTNKTLEEVRNSLTEQRQKADESVSSSAQHAELLERIHTAQVLRESNQTLRDENESNSRKLAQLDTRLQQALAELEPLKEKAQTLQAEVDSKEHNIKLLQEDNERWKVRNQTILAKYERIDPEELHVLKNEVIEAKSQLEKTQEQIATLDAEVLKQTNLAESMRSNWVSSQERFKSLQAQARTTRDEKAALSKELVELKTKLDNGSNVDKVPQEEMERLLARVAALEQEKLALELKLSEQATKLAEFEQQIAKLSKEKVDLGLASATELKTLTARNDRLLTDNKKFIQENREHVLSISKLKTEFSDNNAEAIKVAVAAHVATLEPAASPSQSVIDETVRLQVSAMELSLAAKREVEITSAVTAATAQLQSELATLRKELEELHKSTSTPSTDLAGIELAKKELENKFETEKKEMLEKFEVEKAKLQADAKQKEIEITQKLTAEITKISNTNAVGSTNSTSTSPVDIDALVKAKLVAIDAERLVAQQKAIEAAIVEISTKKDLEHERALTLAREQMASEAGIKHRLLLSKVTRLETAAKVQKAAAASSAVIPNSITPTRTNSALPPLVATAVTAGGSSTTSVRGRGVGVGTRGAVGLSLRGVAAAVRGGRGRGGGGVLGALNAAGIEANNNSQIPKRSREEGNEDVTGGGDLSKRMKGAKE